MHKQQLLKKYWLDENWMYESKIVIEREIIVNL